MSIDAHSQSSPDRREVIVVGGGQAGLAMATT